MIMYILKVILTRKKSTPHFIIDNFFGNDSPDNASASKVSIVLYSSGGYCIIIGNVSNSKSKQINIIVRSLCKSSQACEAQMMYTSRYYKFDVRIFTV